MQEHENHKDFHALFKQQTQKIPRYFVDYCPGNESNGVLDFIVKYSLYSNDCSFSHSLILQNHFECFLRVKALNNSLP